MIGLEAEVKRRYFDQAKIIKMLDRKSRNALIKAGAYIRRSAMQSMRSSKKSAPPGQPPRAHKNPYLKTGIRFGYDANERRMVCGPLLRQQTRGLGIPKLLEKGGMVIRMQGQKLRQMTYKGNPYMQPALDKNVNKIADSFKV